MQCAISPRSHLLRGLLALVLLILAFAGSWHPWLVAGLLIGAFILLRGCPMCWLMDYWRFRRQSRS
jgi:hypothetical protein